MDRDPNDLSTSSTPNPGNSGTHGSVATGSGFGTSGTGREPVRGADLSESVENAVGRAGEKLESARETAGEKLADVRHTASEKVGDAREAASEKLEEVKDATSEKIDDAREAAGEKLEQVKETAKVKLGEAREQLADGADKAREWKRTTEQKLADKLHDGAAKLRDRADNMPHTAHASGTPAYAGAAAEGAAVAGTAVAEKAQSVEHTIARGMDATADWLKDGDIKTTVVGQARTNPVRTVLVALGVGYLIGKILKR